MIKYSFKPISNKDATILILGTMPGEQSILLDQYYGHSRNNFWKLLFTIFETPFSEDYENRKALILNNNIALWDVLQVCERQGSLDSAIKNEVINDFEYFLKNHPKINHIFFNGQKAASFFKKYVSLEKDYPTTILPSTSPANAGKTFEEKLSEWKKIKIS
ncbi:DNA-deoxyinosine glycosylase [Flavobacterium aquatile]|uniref:DNA glycosylase n=1 Tax=Flavobacterium aquatile LMG 4008 = ATCC 11947 TaxID=1453498 RepID=A0A095SRX8_9FLAO|nr:DNA-deoxyinosine glycosylase [Flavobacterium aquatile]KGD67362.1 DNA glycosylase [Flavobacterium aquatile LMG 4008 = ATCC 11947]OXA66904.1 DNA-deoxyinosine glycosylase [Flavobacterium aquatile LMG 4008 = ATCC 11947]GEC78855.1 DNA-deoxyinosine glycosylase [Flavobacterium aquatile]